MSNILDQIRDQVNAMSADEVRAELAKVQEQKAKQKERQSAKTLSPEALEKRKAYNKERTARPEVKAKMKEYHAKPEVKERMKEYRVKRAAQTKAILARAAELGITAETSGDAAAQ